MALRILIVDDHYIVRCGMRDVLEENFGAMIDEAASKEELLNRLHNEYDLILLDINLPDSRNLSIIGIVRSHLPNAKICVFTMLSERVYAGKVLKLGASAFIHKGASEEMIVRKLRDVWQGKEKDVVVVDKYQELKNAQNPFLMLSEKEFEITLLLLEGLGNKEISAETDLKQPTISTFKERIFRKLNVNNSVELFDMALRFEII